MWRKRRGRSRHHCRRYHPAGLEMMDQKATAAVEPFVKAGYD